MLNTLYLPELREMLAEDDAAQLREFCVALHPARTAEFMEGLTPSEAWRVLQHAELPTRVEIFRYFDEDKQVAIVESEDRREIADLITELPPDDRVDLIKEVDPTVVRDLLPLVPAEDRRDIARLRAYPEGTAGSIMTTEVAKLGETLTAAEALEETRRQSEDLETIYYLYVVDDEDHLRGVVSARQLISSMGKADVTLGDLMEADLITVNATDDQEEVANKVARYDILAIPVVDDEHRMLGIITHDDIFDVVREEATEDAHRIAGVAPLVETYLDTSVWAFSWRRGLWLAILLLGAFNTAFALGHYEGWIAKWPWLVLFIPMILSTGGNTGGQSAALIITALTAGDVGVADWMRIIRRELMIGLVLGGILGLIGSIVALLMTPDTQRFQAVLVIPASLLLIVVCATLTGSLLPLLFKRLGLDPALMSNPFVSVIIDILGILIYMNVALSLLPGR